MTSVSIDDDIRHIAALDVVPTILEVVCRVTGLGFSAIARVTEDRWVACAVRDEIAFGLQSSDELQVATTICSEVRDSGQMVVIDSVVDDQQFGTHPTPRLYGFQSYISIPIRLPDGRFFGTLCALDRKRANLKTPAVTGMFTLFADLIALHLDARERLERSQAALLDERVRLELQEQFMAVLGHDLRNPLSAIQTGARLLRGGPPPEKVASLAAVIDRSAARMANLIRDVLDFARSRLGGGLSVTTANGDLESMIDQVVSEIRTAHPARAIASETALTCAIACDHERIGQLLSNLLANALTHGDPRGPVRVRARSDDNGLELSVTNAGEPIPPEVAARLFQPYFRASGRQDQGGLGLGLYIASEIARAHGGTLSVDSARGETRFVFSLPANRSQQQPLPQRREHGLQHDVGRQPAARPEQQRPRAVPIDAELPHA